MTRSIPVSALPASVRATLPNQPKRGKGSAQSAKVRADKASEAHQRRMFLRLCEDHGLPTPHTEFRFAAPDRAFRFDYAWPDPHRVALEVEGGLFVNGAHMRGKHALSDMTKYNLAALRGWRVFRCVPRQLFAEETLMMLKRALFPVSPL